MAKKGEKKGKPVRRTCVNLKGKKCKRDQKGVGYFFWFGVFLWGIWPIPVKKRGGDWRGLKKEKERGKRIHGEQPGQKTWEKGVSYHLKKPRRPFMGFGGEEGWEREEK